ncbi:MAG TPA: hypothetical protein VGV13_14525 [Methylomirabilota bacterium]|nr:hypothetical protein [Methylomirabilota bacterium]
MTTFMRCLLTLALLLSISASLLSISVIAYAEQNPTARHAGRLHSLTPAQGLLVIEEVGANGSIELPTIRIRNADVVLVWRDSATPRKWRERPTTVYRWPSGTFLVVVGQADPSGVIHANRVEISDPHQD